MGVVGDFLEELGGGEVLAVADQEGLVAGLGVGEAGEDGVHQVGEVDQAALVMDGGEGEG